MNHKIIKLSHTIINMYNSRRSVGSKARQGNFFKSSLGNDTVRSNSEVTVERKKYFTSARYTLKDSAKIVQMFLTG